MTVIDFEDIELVTPSFELGPLQTAWVEALESGKYQQGGGCLCKDDRYCCFGVACEVFGLSHYVEHGQKHYECEAGSVVSYPPTEICNGLGLRSYVGSLDYSIPTMGSYHRSLVSLNDNAQAPFSEIARLIRLDPANVFTHSA